MKYIYFIFTILILSVIINISESKRLKLKSLLKKTKSHKSHKNHKQVYSYPSVYGSYVTPSGWYDNSPQVIGTPSGLYTPLSTEHFSSGGNVYSTNADAIPYGTGYSYGGWQPIYRKNGNKKRHR